jgi:adenosylmethionine-8-amino-7-oxononanoate aminotransferase
VLLGWPVLLVAANRLGAVNHVLLSLEALRSRALACPGFIMVGVQEARSGLDHDIRRDNPQIAATLGQTPCLAEIAHVPDLNAAELSLRDRAWEQAAREVGPVLEVVRGMAAAPKRENANDAPGDELLRFDREHLWHPYTSALHPIRVWEAVGGTGTRIRLRDGRELVDGMASWWCAIHGYRHPALMRALHEQAATMPHVMFGGLTHAPAVRLGQRLLDMAPAGLEHVFFADSGSVAVEAALKMALQYWRARGETRRARILTVKGGYHGDTLGAMSVCDPERGMHTLFSGILPRQLFAPRP